jgi:hypothetical protein
VVGVLSPKLLTGSLVKLISRRPRGVRCKQEPEGCKEWRIERDERNGEADKDESHRET